MMFIQFGITYLYNLGFFVFATIKKEEEIALP